MINNIPDQIIREFLNGVISVLVVVAVGAFLFFILQRIARKLPFTRMVLVLALAPLSLIGFLDSSESTALSIYAMIITLLGISIDGIKHLIMPKEESHPEESPAKQEEMPTKQEESPAKQKEKTAESNPVAIVWEKVVKQCMLLIALLLILMTVFFVSTVWILVAHIHMIGEPVETLIDSNAEQLGEISGKVETRLKRDFEQTASVSNDVMKCLALIEKTQEKITELSDNVESLQEDLADERSSETLDEIQPLAPISTMMPENSHSHLHTFDNGVRADCIPFPSEPNGTICIDSKFPTESYLRMTDTTLDDRDRKTAEQQFLLEIKESPKTFWVLVEENHMLGPYYKVRSLQMLENMEAEVFRKEIEDLKKFIKKLNKTSP